MKNFTTVIQKSSNQFDVVKVSANCSKSLYPQTSKIGVVIAVFESNEINDSYCNTLAAQMSELK